MYIGLNLFTIWPYILLFYQTNHLTSVRIGRNKSISILLIELVYVYVYSRDMEEIKIRKYKSKVQDVLFSLRFSYPKRQGSIVCVCYRKPLTRIHVLEIVWLKHWDSSASKASSRLYIYIHTHIYEKKTAGLKIKLGVEKKVRTLTTFKNCKINAVRVLFIIKLPPFRILYSIRMCIPRCQSNSRHGVIESIYNMDSCKSPTVDLRKFLNLSIISMILYCLNQLENICILYYATIVRLLFWVQKNRFRARTSESYFAHSRLEKKNDSTLVTAP